jgi:glycosyltransferase involved in cell wall biosynthesis
MNASLSTPTFTRGTMARSFRILVVTPFPPRREGRHGGARSIALRVERLALHHDVSLLYLRDEEDDSLDASLVNACSTVVAVDRHLGEGSVAMARGRTGLPRILWRTWRGTPIWVQALESSAATKAFGKLVETAKPDVVHVEYQVMGEFLSMVPDVPSLLVIHEPAARIADNYATTRSGLSRLLNGFDRRAWMSFERRLMAEADRVVVFSEEDASAVEAAAARVSVVPFTTQLPQRASDALGETPPAILFVGNYGHAPNVDAALWLIRDIYPRVRETHPTVRLWIVGENPPEVLTALRSESVEITGGVPEVDSWLERAAVFAAPLRLGGGMRVKVVEALAAGKAVVSTSRGVAGLGLSGDEVRIADTAAAFSNEVNELLGAPEKREELGDRARRWAEETLDEEREGRAYDSLYEQLGISAP